MKTFCKILAKQHFSKWKVPPESIKLETLEKLADKHSQEWEFRTQKQNLFKKIQVNLINNLQVYLL